MKLTSLLFISLLIFPSTFCCANQNDSCYIPDYLEEEILCAYALQIYTKSSIEDKYLNPNPMLALGHAIKTEINSPQLDYYIWRAQHFKSNYSLEFFLQYAKDDVKKHWGWDRLDQLINHYLSGQSRAEFIAKAYLIKQDEDAIIRHLTLM